MKFTSFLASHILKSAYKSTFSKFIKMNREQLLELSDADLLMAVTMRTDSRGDASDDSEALAALSAGERAAYTAALFDMEVQNGGLFQYFCNTSRNTAPYLAEALKAIGALRMETLFNDFVTKHTIDIYNLDRFALETEEGQSTIEGQEEFEGKYAQYPFDSFDSAFAAAYQTENLEALTAAFIREHVAEFV